MSWLSCFDVGLFQINKLNLCKPLIRAIDSSDIKDQFYLADLVTYKWVYLVIFQQLTFFCWSQILCGQESNV